MSKTQLFLGSIAIVIVVAIWLGSTGILAGPQTQFKVGDMVTCIKDCRVRAKNVVGEQMATGSSSIVKDVDGSSLLIDANVLGWVPAGNVIPFDTAVSYFTQLVNSAPKDPHNYYFRAGVLQTKGQYDLAIQDYDEAIRLDPAQYAYYIERSLCLLGKKDYARAISDCDKALEREPRAMGAYLARGHAYCLAGDYSSGFSDFRQAVLTFPNSIPPRVCLAELLACCPDSKLRNGQRALELALSFCSETAWSDSETLHYLACAYAECGDFEHAIKWEKKAISLNPPERASELATYQKALSFFESRKPMHEFVTFIR